MNRTRGLSYALLTTAAVARGLLVLRLRFASTPSVTFEFLSSRLTYVHGAHFELGDLRNGFLRGDRQPRRRRQAVRYQS